MPETYLRPLSVALSRDAATHVRCAYCGHPPCGYHAWSHGRLRGLYCSQDCARFALERPELLVGVPYIGQWG